MLHTPRSVNHVRGVVCVRATMLYHYMASPQSVSQTAVTHSTVVPRLGDVSPNWHHIQPQLQGNREQIPQEGATMYRRGCKNDNNSLRYLFDHTQRSSDCLYIQSLRRWKCISKHYIVTRQHTQPQPSSQRPTVHKLTTATKQKRTDKCNYCTCTEKQPQTDNVHVNSILHPKRLWYMYM